ncbi:hypothetical protein K8R66_00175 [bacterium]|nr:hypothetical protein [bacterium]
MVIFFKKLKFYKISIFLLLIIVSLFISACENNLENNSKLKNTKPLVKILNIIDNKNIDNNYQSALNTYNLAQNNYHNIIINADQNLKQIISNLKETQKYLLSDNPLKTKASLKLAKSKLTKLKISLEEAEKIKIINANQAENHLESAKKKFDLIVIDKSPKKNEHIIPLKAIYLKQDHIIMKIIENNKVVNKIIKYAQIINDQVIINDELKEGDQVIIEGGELLNEGTDVEIADY